MKKNRKYWSDIAGYLSGEMNEKQSEAFLSKVNLDNQLYNDYNLMKKSWNKFNSNPDEKYMDTEKAWNVLSNKLRAEGLTAPELKIRPMNQFRYSLKVAATILILVAFGAPAVYLSLNEISDRRAVVKHHSEEGTLTVDLPDGSRIFLNEGSKLEYKKSFEEKRDVALEGEGYFDVMSDPNRPFRVNSGKVVVTVLGTSFNVRESENNSIQVFVETGKVHVALRETDESITLEPGQMGEANEHLITKELQDENYLAWKTKDFKFVDESISTILEVLEKSYHVKVDTNNIPLTGMRLTTSYSDQSFDAILNTICAALNMNYIRDGKVYILRSN